MSDLALSAVLWGCGFMLGRYLYWKWRHRRALKEADRG